MGVPGISGYEIVSQPVTVPFTTPGITATADCPAGKMVIGGGIDTADDLGNIFARDSYPNSSGTGWTWVIRNAFVERVVTIYAICVIVV